MPVTKKYSDFDMNFIPHPTSGDISVLRDADAVKQSLKNLILTNFYERPFQPKLASNVTNLLFEPINPMSQMNIQVAIQDVVRSFEPRVELVDVIVEVAPDENGYNVRIIFAVNAISEIQEVDFFLQRVR
jgi:hypothetical protein